MLTNSRAGVVGLGAVGAGAWKPAAVKQIMPRINDVHWRSWSCQMKLSLPLHNCRGSECGCHSARHLFWASQGWPSFGSAPCFSSRSAPSLLYRTPPSRSPNPAAASQGVVPTLLTAFTSTPRSINCANAERVPTPICRASYSAFSPLVVAPYRIDARPDRRQKFDRSQRLRLSSDRAFSNAIIEARRRHKGCRIGCQVGIFGSAPALSRICIISRSSTELASSKGQLAPTVSSYPPAMLGRGLVMRAFTLAPNGREGRSPSSAWPDDPGCRPSHQSNRTRDWPYNFPIPSTPNAAA